jgi:redox-sensitive bicupin YhaK (pirin superfamily)
MLLKVPSNKIFFNDSGWHSGRFHFSFGDYQDEENPGFGVLSALNDFIVKPLKGFATHTHEEVEIVSYCVQGTLAHKDDLGVENQLSAGDSQYTCTGTGITHSEMNDCPDEMLRFLQIWIRPNKLHLQPHYELKKLLPVNDDGFFHLVASGKKTIGALHIAQDANILSARPDKGQYLQY